MVRLHCSGPSDVLESQSCANGCASACSAARKLNQLRRSRLPPPFSPPILKNSRLRRARNTTTLRWVPKLLSPNQQRQDPRRRLPMLTVSQWRVQLPHNLGVRHSGVDDGGVAVAAAGRAEPAIARSPARLLLQLPERRNRQRRMIRHLSPRLRHLRSVRQLRCAHPRESLF